MHVSFRRVDIWLRGDKRIVAHQKCLNYMANVLFNLDIYSYTHSSAWTVATTTIVISVAELLLLAGDELLMELIFDFIFNPGSLPGNVALRFFNRGNTID